MKHQQSIFWILLFRHVSHNEGIICSCDLVSMNEWLMKTNNINGLTPVYLHGVRCAKFGNRNLDNVTSSELSCNGEKTFIQNELQIYSLTMTSETFQSNNITRSSTLNSGFSLEEIWKLSNSPTDTVELFNSSNLKECLYSEGMSWQNMEYFFIERTNTHKYRIGNIKKRTFYPIFFNSTKNYFTNHNSKA